MRNEIKESSLQLLSQGHKPKMPPGLAVASGHQLGRQSCSWAGKR